MCKCYFKLEEQGMRNEDLYSFGKDIFRNSVAEDNKYTSFPGLQST